MKFKVEMIVEFEHAYGKPRSKIIKNILENYCIEVLEIKTRAIIPYKEAKKEG